MRTKNLEKLEKVMGLVDLGVQVSDREFERLFMAPAYMPDGQLLDWYLSAREGQLMKVLCASQIVQRGLTGSPACGVHLYAAARADQGQKAYWASLIAARGLTCSCESCQKIEAYAAVWDKAMEWIKKGGES